VSHKRGGGAETTRFSTTRQGRAEKADAKVQSSECR
jgi:hypothetical protein